MIKSKITQMMTTTMIVTVTVAKAVTTAVAMAHTVIMTVVIGEWIVGSYKFRILIILRIMFFFSIPLKELTMVITLRFIYGISVNCLPSHLTAFFFHKPPCIFLPV